MNANTAIKNVKDELKKVQCENKKFNNSEVSDYQKQIKESIKEIETARDDMLELDGKYIDNRAYIKRKINTCYRDLSRCYYAFYKNCDGIDNILEKINKREPYLIEFDRLRETEI